MNKQTPAATAILVLRIALGALVLAYAALQFTARAIPAFGADLASMGMPIASYGLPVLLALAVGLALLFGPRLGFTIRRVERAPA